MTERLVVVSVGIFMAVACVVNVAEIVHALLVGVTP